MLLMIFGNDVFFLCHIWYYTIIGWLNQKAIWHMKHMTLLFNRFVPNAPFLYPLKTSENHKVLWCFQEVGKAYIGNKWVNYSMSRWFFIFDMVLLILICRPMQISAKMIQEADVCRLFWSIAGLVTMGTPPGKHGRIHLS